MIERPHRIVLAGTAAFAGLVAVQHAWRAELPPAEHFISEYAHGNLGFVQVAAFGCWAVAIGATTALAARVPVAGRRVARAFVVGGLALATAGAIATAAFATQTVAGELPLGTERTFAGRAHDLGTLGLFAGFLVAAIASTRLVRERRYRLTVLALGLGLLALPAAFIAAGLDAPGWGQRGFVAIGCGWLVLFALTARARATLGHPAGVAQSVRAAES